MQRRPAWHSLLVEQTAPRGLKPLVVVQTVVAIIVWLSMSGTHVFPAPQFCARRLHSPSGMFENGMSHVSGPLLEDVWPDADAVVLACVAVVVLDEATLVVDVLVTVLAPPEPPELLLSPHATATATVEVNKAHSAAPFRSNRLMLPSQVSKGQL